MSDAGSVLLQKNTSYTDTRVYVIPNMESEKEHVDATPETPDCVLSDFIELRQCQTVKYHLWNKCDVKTLADLLRVHFPNCNDDAKLADVAQRLIMLHCDGISYTTADISKLRDPLRD